MRGWELLKLAIEGVRRTPLRFTLTALGVAIATGALISMVAFAEGIQAQAEKPFSALDLLSRIEVRAESEEKKGPVLDDAAVLKIAEIPNVALAYPEIGLAGLGIRNGEVTRTVFATGTPREAGRLEFVRNLVTHGRFFDAGDRPQVVLGKKLAKDLGFPDPGEAIGKRVLIEARGLIPSGPIGFHFDQRTVEVEIVGIYEAPDILGFEAMGQALVLPLDLIRTLPGVRVEQALERMREGSGRPLEGHGRVVVRTYRTSDVPEAEKAIQKLGFKTRSLVTQLEEMKTFFVLMDLLLAAVGSVALVVAGLGIANTLLMAVLERTREIGAYKAIGASDGDVRFLFVAEASLVGLAGGLGGILLARAVAWGIGVGVNLYARSRGVEKAIEVFDFPLWLLLGAVAFAVLGSALSGLYPASRAARVNPIQALREG